MYVWTQLDTWQFDTEIFLTADFNSFYVPGMIWFHYRTVYSTVNWCIVRLTVFAICNESLMHHTAARITTVSHRLRLPRDWREDRLLLINSAWFVAHAHWSLFSTSGSRLGLGTEREAPLWLAFIQWFIDYSVRCTHIGLLFPMLYSQAIRDGRLPLHIREYIPRQ